ncbi:hypothetical protein CH253_26720 [Rhodococcus sp. 06-156-3C]|uniref:hypothetical protein n=1 Tax=Nocardiaceae TaxID=85025 RepID=UPI000522EAB1|nr:MULTISPECIES: hypothetical protein [Rhodococcus]OZD12278.1 hypothetical protein CH253_26720 [Rhodococcus sp. 06-156-3C]OZD19056.1 hypothetical protein CH280_05130 [Rhodococcus sp. 06-156-4C]OZD20904.1 hypothetical protein CH248_11595 [Rhodococcus sp. 06-156-4a]OZD29079.1 hypothetical protein CH247_19190 [Rhodococcus sp. 06-156-3b]OZD33636.1 hypothetical protein CH284_18660 [Rhodococcus sp. 06-156-3]
MIDFEIEPTENVDARGKALIVVSMFMDDPTEDHRIFARTAGEKLLEELNQPDTTVLFPTTVDGNGEETKNRISRVYIERLPIPRIGLVYLSLDGIEPGSGIPALSELKRVRRATTRLSAEASGW